MVTAKEIVSNKFWIVEENGAKIGVLKSVKNGFILSKNDTDIQLSRDEINSTFGKNFFTTDAFVKSQPTFDVHGFDTRTRAFNPVYDVQKRLPIFTKSNRSTVPYCAGYYLIKFNTRWAKKFCPKLETLSNYQYHGPFKSTEEMNEAFEHVR